MTASILISCCKPHQLTQLVSAIVWRRELVKARKGIRTLNRQKQIQAGLSYLQGYQNVPRILRKRQISGSNHKKIENAGAFLLGPWPASKIHWALGIEHGRRVVSLFKFLFTTGSGMMPLLRPGLVYFQNSTKLKLQSQLRDLKTCKCQGQMDHIRLISFPLLDLLSVSHLWK